MSKYFACWATADIPQTVLDCLRDCIRVAEGRAATPSAAVLDSQSVKAAEIVGAGGLGRDADKKINGRNVTSSSIGVYQ